ncbi:hypothetical protein DPMN_119634 [Dreissena polymorpha]|uniref:Uncharacterized protein n=1 Tax=Dreissena polymorpha TaxID=45954 RepID=A0A9D4JMV5_DREPO|nr:hypothetical protein DPMN_119634 [Dreissena polymorpha]
MFVFRRWQGGTLGCGDQGDGSAVTGTICSSCGIVGEIKVFEVRDRKLHCVFVSENMKDAAGHAVPMRQVRSLLGRGDNLYYGDDASARQSALPYPTTRCGDIMLTSAYDLDTGRGYLNGKEIEIYSIVIASSLSAVHHLLVWRKSETEFSETEDDARLDVLVFIGLSQPS